MGKKQVLVFDEDNEDRFAIADVFTRLGHQVKPLQNREALLHAITQKSVDLTVIGATYPQTATTALLKSIKGCCPDHPVILAASGATPLDAVAAIKSGADDFIIKPVEAELAENLFRSTADRPDDIDRQMGADRFTIITDNSGMKYLLQAAKKVADSRASVLIQGESGTGKELIARFVHNNGRRRNKPFVAINCAALPDSLLESELFGHEKGTFTGAVTRKQGRFEQADGGTLLLDEISEMAYGLQAKLLRALQERTIDRIGGQAPVSIDVRILATTNCNLEERMRAGSFRADLYYRLNVIPLRLPPLRERMDDIPLLVAHFLKKFNQIDGKAVKALTSDALTVLMNRSWPGNVRELENVIERAVLMCEGHYISAEDFVTPGSHPRSGYRAGPAMPVASLKEVEKNVIFQALDHTNDNRTHAAKLLGISVRTLRNKLNEYKEIMANQ